MWTHGRMDTHTQKHTVATHMQGFFSELMPVAQMVYGSCSGSVNIRSINRKKLFCPKPEPTGAAHWSHEPPTVTSEHSDEQS